jgi:hypothetical protein
MIKTKCSPDKPCRTIPPEFADRWDGDVYLPLLADQPRPVKGGA